VRSSLKQLMINGERGEIATKKVSRRQISLLGLPFSGASKGARSDIKLRYAIDRQPQFGLEEGILATYSATEGE
jgi:hypothetical protein